MQKILTILIVLTFSHNVFALDVAVENIQALCGLAKQGKYSQIQGKAQLQADGSVKLASIGGKGEISFSKGEWDGVNQVLQAHQAGNLHDYRACVANALPYFKSKVVTPTPKPAAKPVAKASSKPAKPTPAAKPATPPAATTPAPASAPVAESDGDTNTQNIGSQSAEKIINATEINGNIDMGN